MIRAPYALLVTLVLAACGPQETWQKAGGSESAMLDDSAQCRAQARLAAPSMQTSVGPSQNTTTPPILSREEQLEAFYTEAFQKCMRDRGYSVRRQ